jgi:hypothetical protein
LLAVFVFVYLVRDKLTGKKSDRKKDSTKLKDKNQGRADFGFLLALLKAI